ncbi:MAG TPA: hypothetical protein DCE78_02450 [Bacteroidetes bacterium]|nr:hypothetical protein [Bacteroidota bacterium]
MYQNIIWLTIISLFFCAKLNAQKNTLELNPILKIGYADSEDFNYIFSNIRGISVNSIGNIFIANAGDNTTRIFDKNGKYIKKIGGRGRGPDEFLDVSSISLNTNDELTVVDRYQDRITRYIFGHDEIETFLLPESSLGSLTHSWTTPHDQDLFLLYRRNNESQIDGNLIHIYNTESENVIGHHLDVFNYFFDSKKPLEVQMSTVPIYFATTFGKDQIAVTLLYYTGKIITLDSKSFKTDQIGSQTIPFYQEYSYNRRNYYRSTGEMGFVTNSGPNGRFFYKINGLTFGLVGNSKYLLHFYETFEGAERHPFVTIYSNTGRKVKDISLAHLNIQFYNDESVSIIPHFLDENNVLYVADYNEYPKILLYSTNLDDL